LQPYFFKSSTNRLPIDFYTDYHALRYHPKRDFYSALYL
jgi:hypothetical protein